MSFYNGTKPKSGAKRQGKQGQAMAEFAIALPILLLIIFGLIETARLIFIYSGVVTSSREAARYGSALGMVDPAFPNEFQYQHCAGIREAAENVAFLIDPSDLNITIEYDTGPGTAVFDTCVATNGNGIDENVDITPLADGTLKRITVTSSTSYSPVIPIIPQFTINNIETSSSRTFLPTIELFPK